MLRIVLSYDKYIIRMSSIGLADMNLTQLRAFHAVAREKSFTKAARAARVRMERLLGLVKDGTTQSASRSVPAFSVRANQGATPAATAASI